MEGYTDVISLYAKGVQNVVASLGTALTTAHARLLGRFTKHVTIAFDGDQAGERATLRGMQLLTQAGMSVRVARLGSGQDPDGFARSHSGRCTGLAGPGTAARRVHDQPGISPAQSGHKKES